MIVDSSALIALIKGEKLAHKISEVLADSQNLFISAGNALEAAIIVDRSADSVASRKFDEIQKISGIAIHPITATHVDIARHAYSEFGKGSGHPAQLNFGDCFAYALAIDRNEPLLCVGDDFRHTDVKIVAL